jgi:GNAT superfamily N-acetyltransferase
MQIRNVTPEDYPPIIEVLDTWWGGRKVAGMLPKLFFVHFRDTSFIAEWDSKPIGFLIGFLSPAVAEEAYIHFVGVHPEFRKTGVARRLYERFFQVARLADRRQVACVTSPINATSIAFHRALGFLPNGEVAGGDDVPFCQNYDGPGEDRVLLVKRL